MADLELPKPTRATLQVFANDVSSADDAHTPGIHRSFITTFMCTINTTVKDE